MTEVVKQTRNRVKNLYQFSGVHVTFDMLSEINFPTARVLGAKFLFSDARHPTLSVLNSLIREVFTPCNVVSFPNNNYIAQFSNRGTVYITMYLTGQFTNTRDLNKVLREVSRSITKVETLFYKVYPDLKPVKIVSNTGEKGNNTMTDD